MGGHLEFKPGRWGFHTYAAGEPAWRVLGCRLRSGTLISLHVALKVPIFLMGLIWGLGRVAGSCLVLPGRSCLPLYMVVFESETSLAYFFVSRYGDVRFTPV